MPRMPKPKKVTKEGLQRYVEATARAYGAWEQEEANAHPRASDEAEKHLDAANYWKGRTRNQ